MTGCNLIKNEYHEELLKNGFIHFKNVIPCKNIKFARECIKENTVDYNGMEEYIEDSMCGNLKKLLGWDPVYVKYRVSNNNNSADASIFHRDLNCQNPNKVLPVFTLLSYLDITTMELIPMSHQNVAMSFGDMIRSYKKKLKIKIEPGDLFVFNATLLHRGIFTENLKNRRLIQVFDVFPTPTLYNKYCNNIVHVKGDERKSKMMIYVSKIKPIIYFFNLGSYYNSASGYGWSKNDNILKKCNLPCHITHISSEGQRERINTNESCEINKYIIKQKTIDLPDKYYNMYKYVCYTRQDLKITILLIIIIVLLYKAIKQTK